jgi:uncharacterized protein (DUF2147 family)
MGIATAALLAPSSQSFAASADPTGYWMKPDAERESKIQVFKCGAGKKGLCAKIAWLKEPNDSKGKPLHDVRNENPAMRGRSIVGLAIFTGLTPSAPSTWTGKIYNPEDGHTYSATLTVLSRKQILLRGCKAWLLCGEKQWLRTSAPPEEVKPTEQIEASAEPASPPSEPGVEPAAAVASAAPAEAPSAAAVQPAAAIAAATPAEASTAPAAPAEVQAAMAAPQSMPEPQSNEAVVTKASLVTQEVAAPVPPPAEVNARDGYGFLNVSAGPDTAARLSGENVSSMFAMTEPIPADAAAPAASNQAITTAAVRSEEPVPAPAPKPKAKPKPVATAAATAKPAAKTATTPKPDGQAAPAPQEAEAAATDAAAAETPPAETAEAAMTEPVPLTRRQRRLLRKQQEQGQEPFLPWLR